MCQKALIAFVVCVGFTSSVCAEPRGGQDAPFEKRNPASIRPDGLAPKKTTLKESDLVSTRMLAGLSDEARRPLHLKVESPWLGPWGNWLSAKSLERSRYTTRTKTVEFREWWTLSRNLDPVRPMEWFVLFLQ